MANEKRLYKKEWGERLGLGIKIYSGRFLYGGSPLFLFFPFKLFALICRTN